MIIELLEWVVEAVGYVLRLLNVLAEGARAMKVIRDDWDDGPGLPVV